MKFLRWICFIIAHTDVIGYITTQSKIIYDRTNKFASYIALLLGIEARVFVLYGAAAG